MKLYLKINNILLYINSIDKIFDTMKFTCNQNIKGKLSIIFKS